jgi:hypothetical protein
MKALKKIGLIMIIFINIVSFIPLENSQLEAVKLFNGNVTKNERYQKNKSLEKANMCESNIISDNNCHNDYDQF